MDEYTYDLLKKLKLKNCTIIKQTDFEDEQLLSVKSQRSVAEYCWTCTPSLILYCINTYHLDTCTYVDSDIYFFSSPSILIEKLGDKSISLTEHGYAPEKEEDRKIRGTYCVQFMTFRNSSEGAQALSWWRDRCIEWCYAQPEDGKFGDQKYLEDWPVRFKGVHVLKDAGALASWNINTFNIRNEHNTLMAKDLITDRQYPVIFYHYHGSRLFNIFGKIKVWGHLKKRMHHKLLYVPYEQILTKAFKTIRTVDGKFNAGLSKPQEYWKLTLKRYIPKRIKSIVKVFTSNSKRTTI